MLPIRATRRGVHFGDPLQWNDRLTLRSERPPRVGIRFIPRVVDQTDRPTIAQNTYFVQLRRTTRTRKNACFTSLFRACVDAPKIFCEILQECPPLTYRRADQLRENTEKTNFFLDFHNFRIFILQKVPKQSFETTTALKFVESLLKLYL